MSELRPDEVAYLLSSDVCADCPHRNALHDPEAGDCRIPGCDCSVYAFRREHGGHDLVERAGGGTNGPHVGWGFATQPPYLECVSCRATIAL